MNAFQILVVSLTAVNSQLTHAVLFCLVFTNLAPGTQISASLDTKNRPDATDSLPRTRNFSGWTSVKSPKVSVLTSCKVATCWSYLGLNYKRYRQSINDRKCNLSFQLTPSSLVAGHVSVFQTFLIDSS